MNSNLSEELLFLMTKNTDKLSKQTKLRPQEIMKFELKKLNNFSSFNSPLILERPKLFKVTSLEA